VREKVSVDWAEASEEGLDEDGGEQGVKGLGDEDEEEEYWEGDVAECGVEVGEVNCRREEDWEGDVTR